MARRVMTVSPPGPPPACHWGHPGPIPRTAARLARTLTAPGSAAAGPTRYGDSQADPEPDAGQVSIDVSHTAVGLVDIFFRRGEFFRPGATPTPPGPLR